MCVKKERKKQKFSIRMQQTNSPDSKVKIQKVDQSKRIVVGVCEQNERETWMLVPVL